MAENEGYITTELAALASYAFVHLHADMGDEITIAEINAGIQSMIDNGQIIELTMLKLVIEKVEYIVLTHGLIT